MTGPQGAPVPAGGAVPAGAPVPVVLATSNGHGMGHLSRQLAVALALRSAAGAVAGGAPAPEPLVFSLSTATPVVAAEGFAAEYCPSHERGWIPAVAWHRYLRDRVLALLAETGARAFVFDGVAPYLGLQLARAAAPDVAFVWSRRGLWRPGRNARALRAAPFFDLVLEPGDLGAAADVGPTARRDDAVAVPPVSLVGAVDALPRAAAARALGLDPDRPAALVTLGSGVLGDASGPAAAAIRVLLDDPAGWQVAVTRAAIARQDLPLVDAARVVELRGVYPLARYLAAFDAAVSAAGYNAVHELLPAGVPTLLVPNAFTATDDQTRRAGAVCERGLALLAGGHDGAAVADAVRRLCEPGRRADLRAACAALPAPTGAARAAAVLADLVGGFSGHRADAGERVRTADLRVRAAAMRALGPAGTAAVRRALRRTPPAGPRRPLRVPVVEEPPGTPPDAPVPASGVLLTERLTSVLLRRTAPVEQLLPGSSAAYRARRRGLLGRYYDLGRVRD